MRPSQSHYCYYCLAKNHSRVRPDNAASKIQPAPASSRLNYETNGLILWKEIEMFEKAAVADWRAWSSVCDGHKALNRRCEGL